MSVDLELLNMLKSDWSKLKDIARDKFKRYKGYVDLYKEGFTGSLLLKKVLVTRGKFINAFLTKDLELMIKLKKRYLEISCDLLSEQEEHMGEASVFSDPATHDFVCEGKTNENVYLSLCNNEKDFNDYMNDCINIVQICLQGEKIINMKI
jgi:hypothetical protein